MTKLDYEKRLTELKNRRQETLFYKSASEYEFLEPIMESYELLTIPKSLKYALGAMQEVDNTYTQNTFKTGERVKNQLKKLEDEGHRLSFRYQGSVTNKTHIRSHSDIDLLIITEKFYSLEPPQKSSSPYSGNPTDELYQLRLDATNLLKNAFPAVNVDTTGAKSISLEGGSLSRKVDVVPSNWYDTLQYKQLLEDKYRGIMILDCHEMNRFSNTPFYHNYLLGLKDDSTLTKFKQIVRLLKTLKADADIKINLSSYDLAAIPYHMKDLKYIESDNPVRLIENTFYYLLELCRNDDKRNSLYVPDESRKVFEKASLEDLQRLTLELGNLHSDIIDEQKKQIR